MKIEKVLTIICLASVVSMAATTPKIDSVYDVTKSPYNANGSDLIADDAAIQRAINDAVSLNKGIWGAVIYFPKGDYILNNPILIGTGTGIPNTHGIVLEGESETKVSLFAKGGTAIKILGGFSGNTRTFQDWYDSASVNNTIKNLTIHKLKEYPKGGSAIDLQHAKQTTIENVRIFANDGSSFDNGINVFMDYVTIRNCMIEAFGTGSIIRGINLDVIQNMVFDNGQELFHPGPVDGARIEKCHIIQCNYGIYANGQASDLIADNTMARCKMAAIYIPHAPNLTNNRIWGLTIRGNQIEGCGNLQYNQIWIQKPASDLAKGIIIEGNFFNLQGLKDINNTNLYSPYFITDPAQLAQITFNRNTYRNYDGILVSEGFAVGVLPGTSATTPAPMLNVGGNTAMSGHLNVGGNVSTSGQLNVSGNTAMYGHLNVGGNVSLSGALGIGGGTPIVKYVSSILEWDPPIISNNSSTTKDITVNGAAVGDPVNVGHSKLTAGRINIYGVVYAANTVRVTVFNQSGASVNLTNGYLRVGVWKH